MTIFRFRFAALTPLVFVAACVGEELPDPANCPEQDLPIELAQHAPEDASKPRLAKCLTEQAVRLSAAEGSNEEIAEAATVACNNDLAQFEVLANIKEFERGKLDTEVGRERVRAEAARYALTRVVQVRAGECQR